MIKDSLAKLDQQHGNHLLKFYARLNYRNQRHLGIKPESAKSKSTGSDKTQEDLGSLLLELFMLCFKA